MKSDILVRKLDIHVLFSLQTNDFYQLNKCILLKKRNPPPRIKLGPLLAILSPLQLFYHANPPELRKI